MSASQHCFNVGDQVRLNSSDVVRTVTGFSPRGNIWTEYPMGHDIYKSQVDCENRTNGVPGYFEYSYEPECLTLVKRAVGQIV